MTVKRRSHQVHARRRARERYGVEVGAATRQEIIDAIHAGRATVVKRHSARNKATYDVTLPDGWKVRVVYSRKQKEILTFLPRPNG